MKGKGSVWIAAGLLLIAAALFITGKNLWDGAWAEKNAEKILAELPLADSAEGTDNAQDEGVTDEREIPDYILNPDMAMPTEEVDGKEYIGVLEIPLLGLRLPVMSEWSYPSLKIAPCRYEGSAYKNSLIIAGHNYSAHFGNIKKLNSGDSVIFTDISGNVFSYEVTETQVLAPTATEEMSGGEWDLTLFTCTVGGQSRVTVRCELKKNPD